MAIRIGISGWRYALWRGKFYPKGLPQRRELEYAARRFSSVELNGSFYSLQTPRSYTAWREATPRGFVFAVKGSRYITHMRRLEGVETALANFSASGVLCLRERLGPLLWQLPPSLPYDRSGWKRSSACCRGIPNRRWRWRGAASAGSCAGAARCRPTASGGYGMRWRYGTKASAIRNSSPCCAGTASAWWWPTPPGAGRCWRTSPPASSISGCTAARSCM